MPPKTRRSNKQSPPISPPFYGPNMQRKYSPSKKAHYILDIETGDIEWEQKSKSQTDSDKESIDPDKIIKDFEKEENKKEKQTNANIKRRETKRNQKEKKEAQNAAKRTAYFVKKEAQRKKPKQPKKPKKLTKAKKAGIKRPNPHVKQTKKNEAGYIIRSNKSKKPIKNKKTKLQK